MPALVRLFVHRLGQIGLALGGGLILAAAYVALALRAGVVARADRGHRDRARLLHVAQHAADQRHADDAAGARHRRRDLLVGALSRPDRGRRRRARSSSTASAPMPLFLGAAVAFPLLAVWFATNCTPPAQ